MADENLADVYGRARHAAKALRAQANEALELTQRFEELAKKDTPAYYAGTRARATLEQAEELGRVLEELGERLGE